MAAWEGIPGGGTSGPFHDGKLRVSDPGAGDPKSQLKEMNDQSGTEKGKH